MMDIMWNLLILRRRLCSVGTSTECLMLFKVLHFLYLRSWLIVSEPRFTLYIFLMDTCHDRRITHQLLGELLSKILYSDF